MLVLGLKRSFTQFTNLWRHMNNVRADTLLFLDVFLEFFNTLEQLVRYGSLLQGLSVAFVLDGSRS